MKKLLMILVMSLISINPILGEDTFPPFSSSSLDKNILILFLLSVKGEGGGCSVARCP